MPDNEVMKLFQGVFANKFLIINFFMLMSLTACSPQILDALNADSKTDDNSNANTNTGIQGRVTTYAGTGDSNYLDGDLSIAKLSRPWGLDADSTGNLWFLDYQNRVLRKISTSGMVSTIAGTLGVNGFANGTGTAAKFNGAGDIAVCPDGNLYISDNQNSVVRKVTPAGVVTTFAGQVGVAGSLDGVGTAAKFTYPYSIACDSSGNLFVTGTDRLIRKITTPGAVVTTYAGTNYGHQDGPALSAKFSNPEGIAVDKQGNVYVADSSNYVIRKIDTSGIVTTLAGMPETSGFVDGTGTDARFNWLQGGIVVDDDGVIYVSDSGNHSIRKISPDGVVTTLVGNGTSGDVDGLGADARLSWPTCLTLLGGKLYVADTYNHKIKVIE